MTAGPTGKSQYRAVALNCLLHVLYEISYVSVFLGGVNPLGAPSSHVEVLTRMSVSI